MGYMRHHAIVVTTYSASHIADAHVKATALGLNPTPIQESAINTYVSFAVLPDGSKEGWDESDTGDTRRDAFIAWMNAQRFSDGSSPLDWAEVQYGDDEGETCITRHSDEHLAIEDASDEL